LWTTCGGVYHRRAPRLRTSGNRSFVEWTAPMRRTALLVLTALSVAFAALAAFAVGTSSAGAALPHTQKIVVRPVHANGTPVAGYSVSHESFDGFTCSGPSSGAVDNNIEFCGFSATYTVACWKSSNHTVLCLRDPRAKELVRIRYQGTFHPATKLHNPSPQALALFNGNYCEIRDGGAWPMIKGHPQWNGYYGCRHNGIYGTGRDGIDRSVNPWRVHIVNDPNGGPGSIVNRRVQLAYYVGTAS
jgi:hypothetical protein